MSLNISHMRNLAAPFQPTGPMSPRGALEAFQIDENHLKSTYVAVSFPELEDVERLHFDKYCGPTPESNWVIPGKLLVGAYPASESDTESYDLLLSILHQGVNKFVCLQAEYKEGVPEAQWRRGNALRPYFEDVKLILKNKSLFPLLNDKSHVATLDTTSFVHFPIKDCSVTDDTRVLQLALKLVDDIYKGDIIYMHCWGGHGRTGTLVSIMLHLMYGLNSDDSMDRCQAVHDIRQCPVVVGSPQTQVQRDQVYRVIHHLQSQIQHHYQTNPHRYEHYTHQNSTLARLNVAANYPSQPLQSVEDQDQQGTRNMSISSVSDEGDQACGTSTTSTMHKSKSKYFFPDASNGCGGNNNISGNTKSTSNVVNLKINTNINTTHNTNPNNGNAHQCSGPTFASFMQSTSVQHHVTSPSAHTSNAMTSATSQEVGIHRLNAKHQQTGVSSNGKGHVVSLPGPPIILVEQHQQKISASKSKLTNEPMAPHDGTTYTTCHDKHGPVDCTKEDGVRSVDMTTVLEPQPPDRQESSSGISWKGSLKSVRSRFGKGGGGGGGDKEGAGTGAGEGTGGGHTPQLSPQNMASGTGINTNVSLQDTTAKEASSSPMSGSHNNTVTSGNTQQQQSGNILNRLRRKSINTNNSNLNTNTNGDSSAHQKKVVTHQFANV